MAVGFRPRRISHNRRVFQHAVKSYDVGLTALLLFRRKSCFWFLSPWNIHHPRPGFNRRNFGPMASIITTRPQRESTFHTCIRGQVSHLYKTTGKIRDLYILIFRFQVGVGNGKTKYCDRKVSIILRIKSAIITFVTCYQKARQRYSIKTAKWPLEDVVNFKYGNNTNRSKLHARRD
jgi:hypothetical protein